MKIDIYHLIALWGVIGLVIHLLSSFIFNDAYDQEFIVGISVFIIGFVLTGIYHKRRGK